jgi:hypothetical protein
MKFTLLGIVVAFAVTGYGQSGNIPGRHADALPLTPVASYELQAARDHIPTHHHDSSHESTPMTAQDEPEVAESRYVSLFAIGADASSLDYTVPQLTNVGTEPVELLIEFIGTDGKPLALSFMDSQQRYTGRYSAASGTVAPGTTVAPLLMPTREPVALGWMRITASDQKALGIEAFYLVDGTTTTQIAILPAIAPTSA